MKIHRWYAAVYDLMARLDEGRLAWPREQVAGEAEGRVLEIGCGTGANFSHYRWARLESLEASEPDSFMLQRAEGKVRKMPLYAREKVRLTQAPAGALPFAEGHFDTVVATLVLCSVTDLDMALKEIRRVLKPAGCFRLLEHYRATGTAGRIQDFVQPVYGRLTLGCHLDRRTEEALNEAGFRVEVAQRLSFGPLFPALVGRAYP